MKKIKVRVKNSDIREKSNVNIENDVMSDNITEAVCDAVYDVLESFGINECALSDADNDMLTDVKVPLINVIEKLIIKENNR